MAKFFIDRPIFAWVIAIIVMLAGVLTIMKLPIAQYPTIAPPAVRISATYPGADAKTVQDTVTQIIEQNMNGIDNLMYMSSTSDSSGSVTITLTFDSGTDPDIAQVQVQNKLSLATRCCRKSSATGPESRKIQQQLPDGGRLRSDDPNMTQDDIADYVASTSRTRSAVRPAWVKCSCSVPSMRCVSGWIEQAEQLPADDHGRDLRHHRAEQPDRRRPAGRPAAGARAAVERLDHRADPSDFAGRVRQDLAEGEYRRFQCACATSLTSSAVRKATPLPLAITASLPPVWVSNWLPAPTP